MYAGFALHAPGPQWLRTMEDDMLKWVKALRLYRRSKRIIAREFNDADRANLRDLISGYKNRIPAKPRRDPC